jgi:hypothetical protein
MVMKKGSGGDSPLRQGAGRASGPSRSCIDNGGGLQYIWWKIERVFRVFPSRKIYRRKGGVRRWARWPHHLVAQARGWPRRPMVWLAPVSPPSLPWTPSRVGKIGTLAFVSSNSGNISTVAFLKHTNSRKQGTGTVASR